MGTRSCPWRRSCRRHLRRAPDRARSRPAEPGRSRSWRRTPPGARRGARAGASPRRRSRPSWCDRGYRRSWSRPSAGRCARRRPSRRQLLAAEMVSIHSTSQPPSARASACWRTPPAACRSRGPDGAVRRSAPSSPPPTGRRPIGDRTARRAAARLSAPTCACTPCRLRRKRLAPKLLVRMRSEPASTKLLVHRAHALRLLQVPQLGRCASLEAEREQAGAHGAVGEHHGPASEQSAERIGHGPGAGTRSGCAAAPPPASRPAVGCAGPPGRPAPRPQVLHDRQALGIVRGWPAGDLVQRAHAAGRTDPRSDPAGTRRCRERGSRSSGAACSSTGRRTARGPDRGAASTAQATPGANGFRPAGWRAGAHARRTAHGTSFNRSRRPWLRPAGPSRLRGSAATVRSTRRSEPRRGATSAPASAAPITGLCGVDGGRTAH